MPTRAADRSSADGSGSGQWPHARVYRDEAIVLRAPTTWRPTASSRCSPAGARPRGRQGRAPNDLLVRGPARARDGCGPAGAEGRNLDTVNQAVPLGGYGDTVSKDYAAYTTMSVMLETADRLTDEHERSRPSSTTLAGAVRSLAGGEHDSALVPTRTCCGRSRSPAGAELSTLRALRRASRTAGFHVASGGAVCARHAAPGLATPAPATLGCSPRC